MTIDTSRFEKMAKNTQEYLEFAEEEAKRFKAIEDELNKHVDVLSPIIKAFGGETVVKIGENRRIDYEYYVYLCLEESSKKIAFYAGRKEYSCALFRERDEDSCSVFCLKSIQVDENFFLLALRGLDEVVNKLERIIANELGMLE